MFIFKVADAHHLVLAYIRHQDGVVACRLGYFPDHFAHLQLATDRRQFFFNHLLKLFFGIRLKLSIPLRTFPFFQQFRNHRDRVFGITQHFHVYRNILSDFGVVDIQMDDLGLLGIRIQIARHTVVEAHPDGDQDVTFVRLPVRSYISMHTQHTFI